MAKKKRKIKAMKKKIKETQEKKTPLKKIGKKKSTEQIGKEAYFRAKGFKFE